MRWYDLLEKSKVLKCLANGILSYFGSSDMINVEEAQDCTLEGDEEVEASNNEEDVDITFLSHMLKQDILGGSCKDKGEQRIGCAGKSYIFPFL